ncbi:TPA: hypothetical protein QDC51_003809 [Burkholderia multivorans]|uniref:hypothetical protein n=1 Tax=Burkholderia multivorans TaxID=87883 RepID=UPI001C222D38|nr:hypothetical protein [Burkholderia multivorans]MBU9393162.1 hypothetical protein [Burkholderia multivorans]HDR9836991.1 hypothetical protein [Burkholderia multivorans]HDR9842849.1 hypothetical protein [Burkholderia multivorans]HDR9845819.1 hypothetical protein [Burkholderia multivorans]
MFEIARRALCAGVMARIRAHGRDTVATEARGCQRVSMYADSIGTRRRCTRMFRRGDRHCDARDVTSRHVTSRGEQMTNEPRTNHESRHESRASLRTCDVMMERAARDASSTNRERPDERAT